MGYNINPSIVRDSLVLHYDTLNSSSYDSRENFISYSNYGVTWSLPLGNATLTTGIDAPDGSTDAVRFSGTNAGYSLLRVTHPSVNNNGTDPYTVSFYARKISGSVANNGISTDWNDGGPSIDYTNQLVTNKWVRVVVTSTAAATTKSFLDILNNTGTDYVIDFWGVQVERSSTATTLVPTFNTTYTRGTTINSINTPTNNGTLIGNVMFTSASGGALTFTGNSSSTAYISVPAGHADYTKGITIQVAGSMDFTGGAWQRFVDFGNGAAANNIVIARSSSTTQLDVEVYTTAGAIALTSPVGSFTTNENIIWCVTLDGTQLRIYKNGTLSASVNTPLMLNNVVRNNCYIGRSNWADPYLRGNIYDVKIYNRALSATEVAQNAAALRGRLGV